MFGINNCSPLLVGLLRKPLEKYGEATILRLGSLFFVGGGVMAMASGLLGHLGTGQMSALQLVGFLGSTLAIAAGTSIIRFAQNLAITANVGVLEEDIAEEEGKKLAQEDYTWKYLGERVKEVLTKKPESAAGAVHYYQVAQMFKNIGTFAFLGLPWAINALAGLAGYHPNLDFSISYVPYTILALLTTLRLRASAIKDSIPTRITSLENQHIETVTRATDKLSKLPLEKLKYDSKHVTKRVEKMCESANQLLKGYDRQKQAQIEEAKKKAKKAGKPYQEPVDPNAPKLSKKEAKAAAKAAKKKKAHEFIDNLAKESTESVFNALLKRGIPEEQALEASNEVKKAFDELNTYRETSIAETLRLPGIKAGALAITLATIHELSISNGFSFALRHLIPAGEAANAATALTLYGSLTVGRLLGNWLHRRVSDASMYAISSAASVAGTVGMIAAGSNVWALVAGAVVASFGVGNFFSQMYHYFTKLHGRQYERTISLIINYTMPAAAVLSSPMRAIVNWTGIPSIDLTISAVALGASLVLSSKMFAKSSLVRVLQNNVTSAKKGISSFGEKIKKFFSRGKKGPLPPADLDSATPAQ